MSQLPLDLALPPRLGRDDFLRAASNAGALDMIDAWPLWPDRVCVLVGPHGAGKSHLAAIWAQRAGAVALGAADLTRDDWTARLDRAVVMDDADRLEVPDSVLFHLLNLVRETRVDLLLTASAPPERWGAGTPDLLSRLRLAARLDLGPPDDALMRAVLVKLFADRQIPVDGNVVAYLALRLARSLAEARAVVAALDRRALAQGRGVTRPMAAAVLAELELDGDGA